MIAALIIQAEIRGGGGYRRIESLEGAVIEPPQVIAVYAIGKKPLHAFHDG